MSNYFSDLNSIDCSSHVEKKGKFSYLSWPFAVEKLKTAHPTATWDVKRFEGMPFCKTDLGYFVEVEVTIDGVSHSQIHPVLDNKNSPIAEPNPFQINTSIQRCLVKAIGLHGLGLYIYAGEDLPEEAQKSMEKKRNLEQRLYNHNAALMRNFDLVCAVKESLHNGDFDQAAAAMFDIPENDRQALSVAATNGGIWSKEDESLFKSEQYQLARTQYFEDKNNA